MLCSRAIFLRVNRLQHREYLADALWWDMTERVAIEVSYSPLPVCFWIDLIRSFSQSHARVRYRDPNLLNTSALQMLQKVPSAGQIFFMSLGNPKYLSKPRAANSKGHQDR